MAVPVLVLLLYGVVGVHRLIDVRMQLSAVVREAARSGAIADTPAEAVSAGEKRGEQVAEAYGTLPDELTIDASRFRPGGSVTASASSTVSFKDLPGLGWAGVTVRSTQTEPVERYRSRERRGGAR
jgi:Flp pilus assembly protein TadG